MGVAIITLAGLTGVAAALIMSGHIGAYPRVAAVSPVPESPMDEAERILAGRYAKGEIDSDEYARMLTILRR